MSETGPLAGNTAIITGGSGGIGRATALASAEAYDELMNADMRSGFLFSRHAAPVMMEQRFGEILFVASVAGLQGTAGESVYSATKFAQVGFAQALNAERKQCGIKIGTICLGGLRRSSP
jgi:NAD(P)-dependent dehydrogenase (short-subunit alcohol dehydrogenase family)